MAHIPGSRKGKVHECFDMQGTQAAIALAAKLGLAPGTARSWINTWRKGSQTPKVRAERVRTEVRTEFRPLQIPIEKRARPKGYGVAVNVRLQPERLAALDVWRGTQPDLPSRAEALRRLMDMLAI